MSQQLKNAKNKLSRLQKEKLNLDKQKLTENQKITRINSEINRIQSSIKSNTSLSQVTSKLKQIESKQKQGYQIEKKVQGVEDKIIKKSNEITKTEQEIEKYQKQVDDKKLKEQKKIEKEQIAFQRNLQREIERTKRLSEQIEINQNDLHAPMEIEEPKTYDFFISHASEDKEDFVKPLAERMIEIGLSIWYDEFELSIGDSLRRSIDKGLGSSRFGIVVLSSSFFKKNWTQYELDGLVTKEMEGVKTILPIWHKVSKNEVVKYSPTLADKVALNSSLFSTEEIADKLKELVNKKEN